MAENIKNWCYDADVYCPPRGSCRDVNPHTAGQIFSNHSTWNVIVGYCCKGPSWVFSRVQNLC